MAEEGNYETERREEEDKDVVIIREDVTEYERQPLEDREDGYYCPYCGRHLLVPQPPKRCPWCQREFLEH